ncbi:MAG: hypothetical protein ACKOUM_11615 [Sphingopyxis sp.]
MAIAAAQLAPVASLTLLATPWRFDHYPAAARAHLARLWDGHSAAVDAMGVLPMELLQTAFWGADPQRTVAKYARFADAHDDDRHGGDAAFRADFVAIEDWANQGAPLTAGTGRDLLHGLIRDNVTGRGRWIVGGQTIRAGGVRVPARHFAASDDRIAPF